MPRRGEEAVAERGLRRGTGVRGGGKGRAAGGERGGCSSALLGGVRRAEPLRRCGVLRRAEAGEVGRWRGRGEGGPPRRRLGRTLRRPRGRAPPAAGGPAARCAKS